LPVKFDVQLDQTTVGRLGRNVSSLAASLSGIDQLTKSHFNPAGKSIVVQGGKLVLDNFPNTALRLVDRRVESLNLHSTLAVRTGMIEANLPRESVGMRDFTRASSLVTLSVDILLALSEGRVHEGVLSTVVLCGVANVPTEAQVVDHK
jgi:hypothetical protein